ncbi:prolow-density lipoprotein receptor-related protein 1-like, partial [Mustelus asterias]
NRKCRTGYRRCINGRCLLTAKWCNGLDDCGDNSDEAFCNKTMCAPNEFRCQEGTCVGNATRCNQIVDCGDASDEMNCTAITDCTHYFKLGVKANSFLKCKDTSLCYLESWICDGSNDCGDYTDEMNCPGKSYNQKN